MLNDLFWWAVWWGGLGLAGSVLLVVKSARPERAVAAALASIPLALVFGPIFLLLSLVQVPQKLCPHCKGSLDRDAEVCGDCLRRAGEEKGFETAL